MEERFVAALRQERARLLAYLQALKEVHGEEVGEYVPVETLDLASNAIDKAVINKEPGERRQKQRVDVEE